MSRRAPPRPLPGSRAVARVRGAALLLVLWLIVLLTALVGAFALTARVENLQGDVLVRGLQADSAARAGLEYALTRLQLVEADRRWHPDGRPYRWRYAGAEIELRVVDESGKIDLNRADAALIAGLLQALGETGQDAARLAAAVVDWRDADTLTQPAGGAEDRDYAAAGRPYGAKDAPLEGIAELEQVLGFTPALYARVAPHVTVHGGLLRPQPAFASAPVLDALGMDGAAIVAQRTAGTAPEPAAPGVGANRSGTYSIDSHARLPDGRQTLLRAVVRTGGGALPGMAYTPLGWEEGASR